MAVRRIVITGEPVLHQRALEVEEITTEIRDLVSTMFLTMDKAPGVGLAAPQIGVGLRIFVFDWETDSEHFRGVAINPHLKLSEVSKEWPDEDSESEGCLSIPGERYPLKRADAAHLRALDINGDKFEIQASGWLARIFQHEFDHLEGILYADRLLKPYAKELKRTIKDEGWGVPGQGWTPGQEFLEP